MVQAFTLLRGAGVSQRLSSQNSSQSIPWISLGFLIFAVYGFYLALPARKAISMAVTLTFSQSLGLFRHIIIWQTFFTFYIQGNLVED